MVRQADMYDVTVVGAGPVGLYATYFAGLRDCKTKLKEVIGENEVEGAVVWNERSGKEERLDVDAIVLSIGMLTNLEPFREWGLRIVGNGIHVSTDMSTNMPGVYAAGDIVTYPGKILLIAAGAGEAATAVNAAKEYIDAGALGR